MRACGSSPQAAPGCREDRRSLAATRRPADPEPDPEYELATDVVSHVKAALADDDRGQALERSNAAEEALAEALREALNQDLPPDCRRELERILSSQVHLD